MMSFFRPALQAVFVRRFAAVSAADVKILRDRTGAPMLDCKEALKACDGDTSKAIDWLRQKGISKGELPSHAPMLIFLIVCSRVQVLAHRQSWFGHRVCRRQ